MPEIRTQYCPVCDRETEHAIGAGCLEQHPRQPLYRVRNRITGEAYTASAGSAQEACIKLGWLIGNCHIEKLG